MNIARLIAQIAASADGVPVRGGVAVGYCHEMVEIQYQEDPPIRRRGQHADEMHIQIRRPDGSRCWLPARQVRRA